MLDQRYIIEIPPELGRIASLLMDYNFHADDGVRQRARVTLREHYHLVCLAPPWELANMLRAWLTEGGREE